MQAGKFVLVLVCGAYCGGGAVLHAQEGDVLVYGVVKDISSGAPLGGIEVDALDLKWGRRVQASVGDSGYYELELERDANWRLEYTAPGRVPKRVKMDLRGLTDEEWQDGYGMIIDMTLFLDVPGLDLTLGGEAIGMCHFIRDSGTFVWDQAHTARMQRQLGVLREEYDRRVALGRRGGPSVQ